MYFEYIDFGSKGHTFLTRNVKGNKLDVNLSDVTVKLQP